MKEEIEKILQNNYDDKDYESWFDVIAATTDLQKLFLSKQVELLEGITAEESMAGAPHIYSDGLGIETRIEDLELELKLL